MNEKENTIYKLRVPFLVLQICYFWNAKHQEECQGVVERVEGFHLKRNYLLHPLQSEMKSL
jgi:hypothetical protein